MPNVRGKKYPYTAKGMEAAKKAKRAKPPRTPRKTKLPAFLKNK